MLSRTILYFAAAGGLLIAQEPQSQPTSRDQRPSEQSSHDQKTSDRNMTTQGLSSQDRTFLQKVAIGGHKEVAIAKMAVERASSSEVKSFAQRLVDDHSKANEEVQALASQKGVTLG